jgi:phospholipid transport system transporter-binding protein
MIEFSDGRYRVRGPVTLDTVKLLLEEGAHRFDAADVRVDLSEVTSADSSAVALLLAWMRAAAQRGHRIHYENLTDNLRSLIELYELEELLPRA